VEGASALDSTARVGPPLRVTPLEPPYPHSFVYSLGLQGRGGWGGDGPGSLWRQTVPKRSPSDPWPPAAVSPPVVLECHSGTE
jgi:hypothetical protein